MASDVEGSDKISKIIDIFWTILNTQCTKDRCLCSLVKNQAEVALLCNIQMSSRKALKLNTKLLILKFIINKVRSHYVKEVLVTCSPDVYQV